MNKLLIEGLADAVGFVGGALLGFGLGRLLGLDIFSPGYGNANMAGILMIGIGGGAGVQLARYWLKRSRASAGTDKE